MKALIISLLWGLAGLAVAGGMPTPSVQSTSVSVLEELVKRSGIPKDEMKSVLENCDATQLSMNFCSLRDQIVADAKLRQLIVDKKLRVPNCSDAIDAKVAAWQKNRDANCAKTAAKEFGSGSMEPTARLICSTASTRDFTSKLSARNFHCGTK